MPTHYNSCKSIFRERILPHFPHARERFKTHFKQSYNVIRHLHQHELDIPDDPWKPDRARTNRCIELDLALTVLGVKPLLMDVDEKDIQHSYGYGMFDYAGLEFRRDRVSISGIYDDDGRLIREKKLLWVYDPVLIAPMLASEFNTRVSPETVKKTLERLELEAGSSHALLGYPEKGRVRNGTLIRSRYIFQVANSGYLDSAGLWYLSTAMSCLAYSAGKSAGKLEAWALAAAMVEEIRKTTERITSHAGILKDGLKRPGKDGFIIDIDGPGSSSVAAEVIVKRQKGDWQVLSSEG